jgi:hypothetical protein
VPRLAVPPRLRPHAQVPLLGTDGVPRQGPRSLRVLHDTHAPRPSPRTKERGGPSAVVDRGDQGAVAGPAVPWGRQGYLLGPPARKALPHRSCCLVHLGLQGLALLLKSLRGPGVALPVSGSTAHGCGASHHRGYSAAHHVGASAAAGTEPAAHDVRQGQQHGQGVHGGGVHRGWASGQDVVHLGRLSPQTYQGRKTHLGVVGALEAGGGGGVCVIMKS